MIEPTLTDPTFTLYVGDNREILGQLEPASVDCVVTSPPYYGLRDYGTGRWEGGSEHCSHAAAKRKTRYDYSLSSSPIQNGKRVGTDARPSLFREVCPMCGARRVDDQIGLEPSVDEYIAALVQVFEGVRRALAPHGVCWVNLGDSYEDGELLFVPERFALAMREAGWRLVRDVIWFKRNPMPESAKTRPTTCHEYIYMFTKSKNHYYDWHAVMEQAEFGMRLMRSVWDIPTQSYEGAHFATFPRELVRRCIESSCPHYVCQKCGSPEVKEVESVSLSRDELPPNHPSFRPGRYDDGKAGAAQAPGPGQRYAAVGTVRWRPCACTTGSARRHGVVLDPFLGSGTTAEVARDLGRYSVGIELNPEYSKLAQARRAQASLFELEVAS